MAPPLVVAAGATILGSKHGRKAVVVALVAVLGLLLAMTTGPTSSILAMAGSVLMSGCGIGAGSGGAGQAPTAAVPVDESKVPESLESWTHAQLMTAATIMVVGQQVGASRRDQQIAVMTALGESDLGADPTTSRPNSDHDAGVFQLRTLPGWHADGATEDENITTVNNVAYASTVFYRGHTVATEHEGGAGPVGYHIRGLLDVADRDALSPTMAAHAVQGNADPNHYTKWWDGAGRIVTALTATGAGSLTGAAPVNSAAAAMPGTGGPANVVTAPPAAPPPPPANATPTAGLDQEQTTTAAKILAEGKGLGVSNHGLVIAIATALQESGLRPLPGGDRDSRGVFQQRPSMGWGTPEQVMDVAYATRAFFQGSGTNPGLLSISGWEQMSVTQAAQAVQRSAYPDAYADDEARARQIVDALGGTPTGVTLPAASTSCGGPAVAAAAGAAPGMLQPGTQCAASGSSAESGLTPSALQVLRCVKQDFPQITQFGGVGGRPNKSDHPAGRAVDGMIPGWNTSEGNAFGWQVAHWVEANATTLNVKYIIYDVQIWKPTTGWRPYTHPNGNSNPTVMHQDHVHVSVLS